MVSTINIYTVHLKCFDSIRYPLNQYKTLTKNFNMFNQGLNSGELEWRMEKVQTPKNSINFKKKSSKFIMGSKFNIYTVHLKCFDSIRYHLNQYKTLTKNFNQGLNSGELVWKMAKSKHQQKQH